MNKTWLIGRTTKEVDTGITNSGKSYARFTLAVARKGTEETDFINILVWNKLAENCRKYIRKGDKVAVMGRIQVSSYETQDGQKRYSTDVVADEVEFLNSKSGNEQKELKPTNEKTPFDKNDDDLGGDLPF